MRCPKCHYISFESGERCRNCGYDFSLTDDVPGPDLPIASADAPEGPMPDLPLFARGPAERAPTAPPPPVPARAPLAVRRSNPAAARDRMRIPDEPTLDLGAPDEPRRRRDTGADDSLSGVDPAAASLVPRAAAALLDAILIVSIDVAVIYLTLRLCGLTSAEVRVLPAVPLIGFLLLLAGGYIVSFTVAGGQTIGKMAAGIRVVPTAERDPGNARVTLASAVLRATGCLVSLLTAGLGYVPVLVSRDRRALHDRLADTRVVRA